jgi:acetyl-CoA carboxylase biotin carboxyl carrier protein
MTPVPDDDLRWLLDLAEEENLAEVEVHEGDTEVLVRMPVAVRTVAMAPLGAGEAAEAAPALPDNVVPLLSPMAGVFYRAPSPEAPPFVEINDEVRAGDTVGLIEAMKLFNEIPSPVNGTVVKFLAENEEQVEAEQPLMLLEVKEG